MADARIENVSLRLGGGTLTISKPILNGQRGVTLTLPTDAAQLEAALTILQKPESFE